MDIGNWTWRTRIGVGLPLLTASLGFIGNLLAIETPGALPVALGALVLGLGSAALLSIPLSRSVARNIVTVYVLLVGALVLAHLLLIVLPDYYGRTPNYGDWLPAPYGLVIGLVRQGAPLVAGLTLGFMLRILAGMWPRFKRLVDTEKHNPQTIAAVLAAILVTPTLMSVEGLGLWVEWVQVFQGIAKRQLPTGLGAWFGVAIMLALFAIGMVARAQGRSSRALWNRLVVVFAIIFVPAYARAMIVDLAPTAAEAPIAWVTGPPAFAFAFLVILSEAAAAVMIGAWTMALARRKKRPARYHVL